MPTLGLPFLTAEIPIQQGTYVLFDIAPGFKKFHLNSQYEYVSFALRVPASDVGYVQFADQDRLKKDWTAAELEVLYLDYPVPSINVEGITLEPPYEVNAYYDRLTRWVIISWQVGVGKVQIERQEEKVDPHLDFVTEVNTYADTDVFQSYFKNLKDYANHPVVYRIRTCRQVFLNNECGYGNNFVYTPPVYCLDCEQADDSF